MSRRLKKKIHDLCGLDNLSKEKRLLRAKEVLENQEVKQKLCNITPGLTFRDIEKAMRDVIAERQPTERELEDLELRELAPSKFEPAIPALIRPPTTVNRQTKGMQFTTYTKEQVHELFKMGKVSVAPEEPTFPKSYKTYTLEQVQALIVGIPFSQKV